MISSQIRLFNSTNPYHYINRTNIKSLRAVGRQVVSNRHTRRIELQIAGVCIRVGNQSHQVAVGYGFLSQRSERLLCRYQHGKMVATRKNVTDESRLTLEGTHMDQ
jgi:tRNA 2-selenouridine synthase SelU